MHLLAAFIDGGLHRSCSQQFYAGEWGSPDICTGSVPEGTRRVDVAFRILRSALVRQLAITPPEIVGDYREILDESGLMPDPGMIRDCQGSYTPAQHLRFQQRLNDINDIQE